MKAWEVLAIIRDGEYVCEDCLKGKDETDSFNDTGDPDEGYPPLFASDADGTETCGRCNKNLLGEDGGDEEPDDEEDPIWR